MPDIAGTHKAMTLPRYDFEDGDFWGNQIFTDLESGASAWIYWNMILDQNGGPWAVSPSHRSRPERAASRGHCRPADEGGDVHWLLLLSRPFQQVRPARGRPREETGGQVGVRCVAFRTPEKGWVAQLLNSSDKEVEARLAWRGRTLRVKLPAISITTCQWEAEPR